MLPHLQERYYSRHTYILLLDSGLERGTLIICFYKDLEPGLCSFKAAPLILTKE